MSSLIFQMDEFGEWVILYPEKDSKQLENVYN